MSIVAEIERLFATRGDSEYGGEAVSQREHALQAAACALRDGADDPLVVAALALDLAGLAGVVETRAPPTMADAAGTVDDDDAILPPVRPPFFLPPPPSPAYGSSSRSSFR
jgi:predicted HD phosphohydrolase